MTRSQVEQLVRAQGLELLGIVELDIAEDYSRFRAWRSQGRHGQMNYLEKYDELRADPGTLLPGAKRAIVIALPYALGDTFEADSPRVAQYARFRDYHRILWEKGERIASGLAGQSRVVVDSAPVLERALAAKTQAGFIGKNTCYIHPQLGSFLLLGEILTTAELDADEAAAVPLTHKTKAGGCGPCDLCQVHCPTGALDEDYRIDAARCLSYWTIEQRGAIPFEFWPHLATYYFGCDLCQLACPYNKQAARLPPDIGERKLPSLFQTATMTEDEYRLFFGGTPLTRAKRNGLRRNALIAMTVTNDPRLPEAIARAREDAGAPVGETLLQIEGYLAGQARPEVLARGENRRLH